MILKPFLFSWLYTVCITRRRRCHKPVRSSTLHVNSKRLQALGVGVFEDASLLVRVVRLVIVAVGPQHARQVGSSLVSFAVC